MNDSHQTVVNWMTNAVVSFAFFLALAFGCDAQSQVALTGQLQDATGAAISGAEIRFRSGNFTASTRSGTDGRFTFVSLPVTSGTVTVAAPGFREVQKDWSFGTPSLVVRLQPATSESIVVSATRTGMKLSDLPGSAILLSDSDLDANPALTTDDMLRQVPGFQLFRRSSSRVANPTTQGVSLRGVGASGPSRALVLEDNVPLVDPFGGWVYWDRIPREELSAVEIVRGGGSNLYGSDALGGVIQFVSKTPTSPSGALDFSYGNENTPALSAWGGTALGAWNTSASVDMSRTDGYIVVPANQRGAVDTLANSKHRTVDANIGYKFATDGTAFLRGTFFDESRKNGTPLTVNSTTTGFGATGVNAALGTHDWIAARIYGEAQDYDQTFSSVAPDRNSEQLTTMQHVPSQSIGGSAQWNHLWGIQTLVAGIETENVMGSSDEQLVLVSTHRIAGGRQRSTAVFGQDILHAGKWTIVGGVRWDGWRNSDGSIVNFTNSETAGTQFPDRTENVFSPRLSLLRTAGNNVSVFVSGYRAFRAPTLNELYRSFRQGNSLTQSNAFLGPERSTGAEAGIRSVAAAGRLESRATVFWNDIVDPVTNVTLNVTPTLITRQRQNLGRTRSLGAELEGVCRFTSHVQFTAGYQYTHATVIDSVPALVGLNVPEVPRHQISFEGRYWNPATIMLSVQGRYSGQQYDDDLNAFSLRGFYIMNLYVGKQLHRGLSAYIAAENVFNHRYPVSLSAPVSNPLQTLGPPILARIGVRYEFPASR